MNTYHWIFSYSQKDMIKPPQSKIGYRPSTITAMHGKQKETLTQQYRSRIKGLYPICNTNGNFIGHA